MWSDIRPQNDLSEFAHQDSAYALGLPQNQNAHKRSGAHSKVRVFDRVCVRARGSACSRMQVGGVKGAGPAAATPLRGTCFCAHAYSPSRHSESECACNVMLPKP